MRFLKYGLAVALIAVIAIYVAGCSREPLAATVNGKNITVAEVDERLKQMMGNHMEQFKGEQGKILEDQVKYDLLNKMIERELLVQEADKLGIKVSKKQLDAKIKEMMKAFNLKDEKALLEALKQQSMTLEQFKEDVEKYAKVQMLGERITKDVKVAPKEVEDYYNLNKNEFLTKDQVHAAHILVDKEEDAKKILKELRNGADFAELARKYSIDTGSKSSGGDLSWKDKDMYVKEFADACWSLEPGQLSEPVKTQYGYHIIKLIDKKPARQKTFSEVESQIKEKLVLAKKQELFNKWYSDIKKKAVIKIYLKQPQQTPTAPTPGAPSGNGNTQGQ
ncbi:MAG: peptidylprolyl isomerase [Actinomycetota bacterium]|nr:peptidylprolyl isomerase [Actinomycetota bacterium]